MTKGATTGGSVGGGPDPPKFGRTTPTSYAAADCSARNWVYHPYFVKYTNLDQFSTKNSIRGVATGGGYIDIYTLPKSVPENYFVH